jgi:hypothetical protein
MDGMEPDFRSINGDWNMLSMKSHHILGDLGDLNMLSSSRPSSP